MMRRHPSWPGSGSGAPAATAAAEQVGSPSSTRRPVHARSPSQQTGTPAAASLAAADTENGDSDSDGDVGVSQDGQEDAQEEGLSAAAAAAAASARRSGSRTYTAEEQAVMRKLKLRSLTNITRTTSKAGTMCWKVGLFAEGLAKSGHLHREWPASLSLCGPLVRCALASLSCCSYW
jgi:hypothetical protein